MVNYSTNLTATGISWLRRRI